MRSQRVAAPAVVALSFLSAQTAVRCDGAAAEHSPLSPPGHTLRRTQVVFRHGARLPMIANHALLTPVDDWPPPPKPTRLQLDLVDFTKPSRKAPDAVFADVTWGQAWQVPLKNGSKRGSLTVLGLQQATNLGTTLRKRYVNDLKLVSKFDSNDVYLRSTHTPRTVQSLAGVLVGLFPELEEQGTTVDCFTTDRHRDTLTPSLIACPRLREIRRDAFKAYSADTDIDDARKTIAAVLGMERSGLNPMLIHDVATSRLAHKLTMYPQDVDWDMILPAVRYRSVQMFMTWACINDKEGQSLGIGRFLDELKRRIDAVTIPDRTGFNDEYLFPASTRQCKLLLYSAHDTTIVSLLKALDVNVREWPQFSSHLAFEVWENNTDGSHHVQVLYEGKVLPIHNKPSMPAQDFRALVQKVIPRDFRGQCRRLDPSTSPPPPPPVRRQPEPAAPSGKRKPYFDPVGGEGQ